VNNNDNNQMPNVDENKFIQDIPSNDNPSLPVEAIPDNSVVSTTPEVAPPVVEVPSVAPPTVASPVVAPPTAGDGNSESINNVPNKDDRILKPIGVEYEILDDKPKVEEKKQESESSLVASNIINYKKDEAAILENRKMKEVNIDYKGPGKVKTTLMIFLFGGLILIIVFLPEITKLLDSAKNVELEPIPKKEEITTGVLECSLESNDADFNYIYSYEFHFKNKELKSINFADTTQGDRAIDGARLEAGYNNCKALSLELETLDAGASMSCDLYNGSLNKTHTLDYSTMDVERIEPIYSKYKEKLPDYEYNQNIDDIEKSMNASGYTCSRNANK